VYTHKQIHIGRFWVLSIVLLLANTSPLLAQERDFLLELSGSVLYSFSRSTTPPQSGESFSRYFETNTIGFQPSLGYFLTQEVEALLGLRYSLEHFAYNYGRYSQGELLEGVERRQTHRVGFSIGIAYNYLVSESFDIFIATEVGSDWSRTSLETDFYPLYDTGWQKPEISFPNFALGGKFFVDPMWALLAQVKYSHTIRYQGNDDQDNSKLSVGLGFSVFLR